MIAGAGTGKTRALTHRVARLVAQGADPRRVLLLTFTQKAAAEMIHRIGQLLEPRVARAIWAGTFHAITARLLRQYADRIGLRRDFGLLDPPGALELLGDVLGEAPPAVRGALPSTQVLLRVLSLSLNTDRPLEWALERLAPAAAGLSDEVDALLATFCARKVELNLLDYDDLLAHGHLMLSEDLALRDHLAQRFEQVLVDEYQDTNPLQAALVGMIGGYHRNICAVGDDAQAIYGFRGADVGHILRFTAHWPDARVVRLETNYRSTPQVVAVANRTLEHLEARLDKTLVAAGATGPRPVFIRVDDPQQEARFIAQRALELAREGVPLGQQAVLYRAHAHGRLLQLELARAGVPFTVRSGTRFFEQSHIRDALAWIRVRVNPLDVLAWRQVFQLQPGVGASGAERVLRVLFSQGDPVDALRRDIAGPLLTGAVRLGYHQARATLLACDGPGIAGRPGPMIERILADGYLAHLRRANPETADQKALELRALAGHAEHSGDPAAWLEALALVGHDEPGADDDRASPADQRLVLSSIHQAKGLEFDAVFLLALSEGWFPGRMGPEPGAIDEERRLFYVAVTRARRWLYLCSPAHGSGDGGPPRGISRFVSELPETDQKLVDTWHITEE